jgi:hypothetical protein
MSKSKTDDVVIEDSISADVLEENKQDQKWVKNRIR